METKIMHFTVGKGLDKLARQGYWFEDRKEWAIKLLRSLCVGINQKQLMAVINGDAQIKPIKKGTEVELVYKEDLKFKKELFKYQDFLKNKDGYWTPQSLKQNWRKGKDCDLCKCGHPRYMHNHSRSFGHMQCKVHGCRHDNNPCKKFANAHAKGTSEDIKK